MKQLSAEQIAEIKALFKAGATQVQLSKDYGVSRATIQNYIRGHYIYKIKKKAYGDLTQEEWNRVAKENHKKLSRREDAVTSRVQASYSQEISESGYRV